MKINKSDFQWDRKARKLKVYMRSQNPVSKGVTFKAQKFLKSKGIYGAICFFEGTEPAPNGCLAVVSVHSFQMDFSDMLKAYQ